MQDSCTINSKASQISWTVQLKTMRNHQKASETTHHHPSKVDIKTAHHQSPIPNGNPNDAGAVNGPGSRSGRRRATFPIIKHPRLGSTSLLGPPYGPTWHDELRISKANTVTMPVSEALKMIKVGHATNADVSGDPLTLAPHVFLVH